MNLKHGATRVDGIRFYKGPKERKRERKQNKEKEKEKGKGKRGGRKEESQKIK